MTNTKSLSSRGQRPWRSEGDSPLPMRFFRPFGTQNDVLCHRHAELVSASHGVAKYPGDSDLHQNDGNTSLSKLQAPPCKTLPLIETVIAACIPRRGNTPLVQPLGLKREKGFTLVELMITLAIVSLFTLMTIMSTQSDDSLKKQDEQERIISYLSTVKKENLLMKREVATVYFRKGEQGYYIHSEPLGSYGLDILSVLKTGVEPTFTFTFQTMKDTERYKIDPLTTTMYVKTRQDLKEKTLEYNDNNEATFSLNGRDVDRAINLYFQDPKTPANKSNEDVYMLFSESNVDDNDGNDIQLLSITSEYNTIKVTFDAFGQMIIEGEGEGEKTGTWEPISSTSLTFGIPGNEKSQYTLTLPDDVQL